MKKKPELENRKDETPIIIENPYTGEKLNLTPLFLWMAEVGEYYLVPSRKNSEGVANLFGAISDDIMHHADHIINDGSVYVEANETPERKFFAAMSQIQYVKRIINQMRINDGQNI